MNHGQSTVDDARSKRPRPEHGSRRPLWICAGIVLVLAVATAYVELAHSRGLVISKETTHVIEPLKSDGEQVDYFAVFRQAFYPPNIATEENGYRLIVQHLGRPSDCDAGAFAFLCRQLGLDVDTIRPDMKYGSPDEYLRTYFRSSEFDKRLLKVLPPDSRSEDDFVAMVGKKIVRPWTLKELPMMAPWLQKNGPALDLIGHAVRKPVFYIPLALADEGSLQGHLMSDTSRMESLGSGLTARANYHIAAGDMDGAIDDLAACHRLGRHLARGPGAFDMGATVEASALSIGIAGVPEHPPTREQLQRLLAELDDLPLPRLPREMALADRLYGLDMIQAFALNQESPMEFFDSFCPPLFGLVSVTSVDWNITAHHFNQLFDGLPVSRNTIPYDEFMSSHAISLISRRARSRFFAGILFWYCEDSESREATADGQDCQKRMLRITLAMLLYELDHGVLPPAWTLDAQGKPLHSWRVLLLPYLGHQGLYEKLRLNEPWDSEHNRAFHGEDLAIYRCPSNPAAGPGQTTYSVVVGPEVAFQGGQGRRLADVGSHGADLILLVERMEPVGWMEPAQEIEQADADLGSRFLVDDSPSVAMPVGSHHWGGIHLGFRSGAVRCLSPYWYGSDPFIDSQRDALLGFQRMLRGIGGKK